MTYVVHHRNIRISRNGWHTLLNFLFHTGLTFGVFAGGINQVNVPFVCQIVGIVLHYASLSTLLWLTFTARNICKDVSRDPGQTRDRKGPAQTRSKPSVLRFYLVGDGVPLVIVGVTAAFGLDNYGSRDSAPYCWMAWEPSLGGFYGPAGLLVLVMAGYFLLSYVRLRLHPERRYELRLLSEERPHPSSESNHVRRDGGGASCPNGGGAANGCFPAGATVLANEHSFKSQLRAAAFTLFLLLSTWALGGAAVALGHFLDMVFSCLYGAFVVTLGLFLLIQHCAKRDDVWTRWWGCCRAGAGSEEGGGGPEPEGGPPRPEHQPHCHLSSPCPGKPPPPQHLLQSYDPMMPPPPPMMPPPPQSPVPAPGGLGAPGSLVGPPSGPCCLAVLSPPLSPAAALPSPRPQSLPDELPRPALPLQSCLADRTKSRSFHRPRPPYLQDYRAHGASLSLDGSVCSSHLDSPLAAAAGPCSPHTACSSPHPDLQLPGSPHPDLQACLGLQRQTSCHSVQDSLASLASCHNHNFQGSVTSCHNNLQGSVTSCHNNLQGSVTSCHSLLLPSCPWPPYPPPPADPTSDPCCCRNPDLFACPPDPIRENEGYLSDLETRGFPRNTLPRQHATLSRRAAIGRNRSLQEDGLFGSDATGNIRTGPWKNETTV
ncbi:adhesion G protein-coupled receptor A1-like isoform X2 [Cololabis saira]|nr:adhesion G protein-coupled receptor A1-like isoform X2 [Cololabis saira]